MDDLKLIVHNHSRRDRLIPPQLAFKILRCPLGCLLRRAANALSFELNTQRKKGEAIDYREPLKTDSHRTPLARLRVPLGLLAKRGNANIADLRAPIRAQ